ncbi:MAG: nucleotide exchange factor GrpE [Candidatus Doudnabacteria bacterium RIFCSPHIGHO2_01_FULL_49_9]|uniref:Protein GrpE n=1 Tax=Candidatus Doudnabacteria bacterium RIFCSPHIGHO2_01_FULL_49_9 TaxID=1817827 RepID=A0A1F5P2Q1_9BACT|nr:MAG: nucleotide exchange factor GrpE [Candidatus Doudnabacteria bacterium RIFCSPHIGHO2_01_FULL_49_9]
MTEESNQIEELEEYKAKAEQYLDNWKRTAADFENYKKRRDKEGSELIQFAREITVVKMLPTLESLEQALKNAPDDEQFQTWSEGVIKIVQQLEKILLEMGVEKIKTVGEKFDFQLHEAVEMIDPPAGEESGTIIEEIQGGYKLNNKIIRPAKVKVVK